jgi:hypothetical protein
LAFSSLRGSPLVTSFLGALAPSTPSLESLRSEKKKADVRSHKIKKPPGRIPVKWKRFQGINSGNEEKVQDGE